MIATTHKTKAEQMMAELEAQEIRGMERYATDAPSEQWGAEFHAKLARWRKDLADYEATELAERMTPARPAAGEGGTR